MIKNALTDVAWVDTTAGALSLEQALLQADRLRGLNLENPGLVISATFRVLQQVAALVVRHQGGRRAVLKAGRFNEEAVSAAVQQIGAAADIYDDTQPFLQRPAERSAGPKDTARRIGTGYQPIKKLFPYMPPDQAEAFWSLPSTTPATLTETEAITALAVFHCFSPAGNNFYGERSEKCAMGAPGLRFLGKDNTATEVLRIGENLFETILLNTPRDWANGIGLPAWADRTGATAYDPAEGIHPLWQASWSSNAPVLYWENGLLSGVRIGGIPERWYHPAQGADKAERKRWWDTRNTSDPLYLYMENRAGELKAQRLDLQRDIIDLAVEWNAESKAQAMRVSGRLMMLPSEDEPVMFLRHQIGGTASSPSVRASEVLIGDSSTWAPSQVVAERTREYAELVRRLHGAVTSPFRRARSSDKSNPPPAILESLESRRSDASALFWRNISGDFRSAMAELETSTTLSNNSLNRLRKSAVDTFDAVTAPHAAQLRGHLEAARAEVESKLNHWTRKYQDEGTVQ